MQTNKCCVSPAVTLESRQQTNTNGPHRSDYANLELIPEDRVHFAHCTVFHCGVPSKPNKNLLTEAMKSWLVYLPLECTVLDHHTITTPQGKQFIMAKLDIDQSHPEFSKLTNEAYKQFGCPDIGSDVVGTGQQQALFDCILFHITCTRDTVEKTHEMLEKYAVGSKVVFKKIQIRHLTCAAREEDIFCKQ